LGQEKFGCVVVQIGLFREIGYYPLDGHSLWLGPLLVIIQKKKNLWSKQGLLGIFLLAFLQREQGWVPKLGDVADFQTKI
jgi:hypothetical protein